jgi:nitrite reductase/ring-hydroxylating ferredoxin subunit
MPVEEELVAQISEIPAGTMKRIRTSNGKNILLANVDGKVFATQADCGHQRANLARGTLSGKIVTCPLHGAQFDVTTGQNTAGIQMRMDPNMMQKLPQEMLTMFQRTAEIVSDIEIQPLKTYRVEVKGNSIFLGAEEDASATTVNVVNA